MLTAKCRFCSQLVPALSQLGVFLALALAVLVLCPCSVYATIRDVTGYGAKGDGTTDDTSAINSAIAALQPGDTLYFPCTGGGSIYLVTSQLTISQTSGGVPLSNVTVEGDSSGCVTIQDKYPGPYQQAVMLIGGDANGNPNPRVGTAVPLSTTANELATSFTTTSSLGVGTGDYVYLCQGGVGGNNGGTSTVCGTANSLSVTCDPSGCRGEVVKIAFVSGNTITVTSALHDTYIPSPVACTAATTGNCATAQKIMSPLTGVTIRNLTFNGLGFPHVVKGLALAGVAESTVSAVKSMNVQGSAIEGNGGFNVAWNNITVTGAGSELCGAAVWLQNQGNLSVNGMSISQENTVDGGIGCAANDAFGFELISVANSSITNLSVDAANANGRPFKTTAARWTTFNSPSVQNGSYQTYNNGITMEYYSSHNSYNSCIVKNNGLAGSGTGNAGINLFGNYNQYNTFNNCTVSGNGNVQFFDQNGSQSNHQSDSHNTINGGSLTGANTAGSVMLTQADSTSVYGATFTGPGSYGIELDIPATNACVNNNTFGANLSGTIKASGSSDLGSGNQLSSGMLTQGACGNNFGYAVQGPNAGTTMSNKITASRYQMASQSGTVTSISVFVASPVSASPNNQFQVAIYADNNSTPGELIASSASQTIVADAWNTVLINAPATANAYYWIAYNTNGLAGNANNIRYDTGGMVSSVTPEPFGTWPSTFGTPSGRGGDNLSMYATVQFSTVGHEVQGANIGTTMSNRITASRFQMAGQNATITSVSAFVASPVSASPNNQFQVAIYADNNGTPGALIASSASQTIVPDAWNPVPIRASVTANSYYWLAYNTNGLAENANNLRFDPGGMMSWFTSEMDRDDDVNILSGSRAPISAAVGTWPGALATPSGTGPDNLSIYATFQVKNPCKAE